MKGTLFIVSTPIGNLGDITLRAIHTLKKVDLVAAEDTRHTRKLLTSLEIQKPLVSFHAHNAQSRVQELIELLKGGKDIALVTDAGTPIISDPGEEIVDRLASEGLPVVPIPGACAAITALTVSALPADKFVFEGFLPRDKNRKQALERVLRHNYTTILYESPHALLRTLEELAAIAPTRRIAVCHELTKIHESILRTTIQEAVCYYQENPPRGEFVLVIEAAPQRQEKISDEVILAYLEKALLEGATNKDAVLDAATQFNIGKNRVYSLMTKGLKNRT